MPIFHILFIISFFQFLSSLDDSKQCTAGYFQRNIALCEKCEEFCNTINTLSIENQETCKPYCFKPSSVTFTIINSPTTAPIDKSNSLIYIYLIIPIIVVIAIIAVIIVCIRSGRFQRGNVPAVPVHLPLIPISHQDSSRSHHSGDDPYPSIHRTEDPSGDCSPSDPFMSIFGAPVTPTEEAGNLISGDPNLNSLIIEAANETIDALLLPSIIGSPRDEDVEPPGGAGGAGEDFVMIDRVGDDHSVGQGTVILPSQGFTADAQNTAEGANKYWSADSEAILNESIWNANRKIAKNQGYSSTDKT